MKKDDLYHSPEEGPKAKLHEPEAVYQPKAQMAENYQVWPLEEALKTGMPLEEFIRRLEEKVHKHFHS